MKSFQSELQEEGVGGGEATKNVLRRLHTVKTRQHVFTGDNPCPNRFDTGSSMSEKKIMKERQRFFQ
jgi:hypothetical protein